MSTKSKPSEAESTSLLRLVKQRIKSLLRLVKKRIKSKGEPEEKQKEQEDRYVVVPDLPEGCIYDILLRLPLESLCTSRFVCKSWYEIVNRPDFMNAHRQPSDVGLIFLTRITDPKSVVFRIKFAEIKDGECTLKEYNMNCMGQIRATCDGLVLLDDPLRKGLLLLNPVTKEMMNIPFGTTSFTSIDTYGLAFCHASRRYKLVHMFTENFKHIGCEIMDIGSRSWRVVEGPDLDERAVSAIAGVEPRAIFWPRHKYYSCTFNKLAFAMGALHWVLSMDHNEVMLSMTLDDEKFRKIPFPKTDRSVSKWIFEMDGFVAAAFAEGVRFEVWILRGLNGEGWEEMFSINFRGIGRAAPIFCGRVNGELVFVSYIGDLYVYDRCSGVMRKITMRSNERPEFDWSYFPHVNSLISWRG